MSQHLLSHALSEEVVSTSERFDSLVTKSSITDELLTNTVVESRVIKDELITVIKHKKDSEETKVINHYEELLNKGLYCLIKTVYAGTYRLNEVYEKHANKLYEVFERHGTNISKLSRSKKTATMASIFKELKQAEYQESITFTGTQILIDETEGAYSKYNEHLDIRSNSNAEKEDYRLKSDIIKDLRDKLDHIVNYVNLLNEMKDDELIKTLQSEITEVITQANAVIRGRNTRNNNETE